MAAIIATDPLPRFGPAADLLAWPHADSESRVSYVCCQRCLPIKKDREVLMCIDTTARIVRLSVGMVLVFALASTLLMAAETA